LLQFEAIQWRRRYRTARFGLWRRPFDHISRDFVALAAKSADRQAPYASGTCVSALRSASPGRHSLTAGAGCTLA